MTSYQLPARRTSKRALPKGTAAAVGGTVAALAVVALVNRFVAVTRRRNRPAAPSIANRANSRDLLPMPLPKGHEPRP